MKMMIIENLLTCEHMQKYLQAIFATQAIAKMAGKEIKISTCVCIVIEPLAIYLLYQ